MCLATTIYLEARNQPLDGQWAIAEVALRRRDSGRYGSQLCDVLKQPKQFALTLVSPERSISDWRAFCSSWGITVDALRNWQLPVSKRRLVVPGADHFLAYERVSASWASGAPLHIIGDHGFYQIN